MAPHPNNSSSICQSRADQNCPTLVPTTHNSTVRPLFKPSPFYTVIESVTPVFPTESTKSSCRNTHVIKLHKRKTNRSIAVREQTRDHIDIKIALNSMITTRLETDMNTKVMVYCASEPIHPYTKVDITFPNQMEIKINGDEVKANLRGLKNKPGTTRPADITKMLRTKPVGYQNTMHVVYALTNKVSNTLYMRFSTEERTLLFLILGCFYQAEELTDIQRSE